MYDTYEPVPPIVCPYCGTQITRCQSKDGPCLLLVWRQGLAAPVRQDGDWGWRSPEDEIAHLAQFSLPEEFAISSFHVGCRACPRFVIGRTENNVWVTTTLFVPSDAPFNEQADLNDENEFSPHVWKRNGDRI